MSVMVVWLILVAMVAGAWGWVWRVAKADRPFERGSALPKNGPYQGNSTVRNI
jgi:hypothetical protein